MGDIILILLGMVLETYLGWGAKIVKFIKEKIK